MKKTLLAVMLLIASQAFAEEIVKEETAPIDEIIEEASKEPPKEEVVVAPPVKRGVHLEDISIGIGNLTQFVNKIQTDESGDKNLFTFLPYIQLGAKIPFTERFSFFPEFTITIPKKSNDDLITKLTYIVMGNIGYDWRKWTFLTGLGISYTRLSAEGGYKELNNGNGFDSFPIPNGHRTSSNIIVHLGASYEFKKNLSAKAGLHFYNIEDSDERAVSYTIGLTYHFGDMIRASGEKK